MARRESVAGGRRMSGPQGVRLPDRRLHLQQGPIDCIVEAWGDAGEIEAAYAQAARCFDGILTTLVAELNVLRASVCGDRPLVRGPVAGRMVAAVWPHREVFVTPMAAVAGSVADELLAALVAGRRLDRAYVNDGGDIALHLGRGTSFSVGIAADPALAACTGRMSIDWRDPVRGIATSGWRGRSQSLGIADAVTVLAANAAAADAAATLIANAVNVEHPAIRRRPAREVKEDSDLGLRPVTVEVGALPDDAVDAALDAGLACARSMRGRGLIEAACLTLSGRHRVTNAARQVSFEVSPVAAGDARPANPVPSASRAKPAARRPVSC